MAASGLVVLFLFFGNIVFASSLPSCKDETGKQVDWYMVYKLPRLDDSSHKWTKEGVGYFYMDSNKQSWVLSGESINSTNNAVYFTLKQVYDNYKSKDVMYLLYNDETPPKHVSFNHGHTKGDVLFDKDSGFWLVHSVPRFPPYANESYAYPPSGTVYGQTMLCMTFPYERLDVIGKQLLFNYPQIYDYNMPEIFAKSNPNVVQSIKKVHVKTAPWNGSVVLPTAGGVPFTSFAKFTDYGEDLYDAWIAPHFQSSLYVESWQNGKGKLLSNCTSKYEVFNIDTMRFSSDASFKESDDHAKWTITTNATWICIGDINRMSSQKARAGGTVCANLPEAWNAFKDAVNKLQQCPKIRTINGT